MNEVQLVTVARQLLSLEQVSRAHSANSERSLLQLRWLSDWVDLASSEAVTLKAQPPWLLLRLRLL